MTLRPRSVLDKDLQLLNELVVQLASYVDAAIENSMTALKNRDLRLAEEIILGDREVNNLRYRLENEALRVLATQQPAAGDLRTVVAAIHLAVELERIGDHAAGIAKLVERMQFEEEIESLYKLPKMAKRSQEMVSNSIQAYVDQNAEMAEALMKRDNKIDKQYRKLFSETMSEMRNDADYVRRATYLLWVGHNFERIGDRATNIAERVIFMVTAEHTELQEEYE